MRSGRCPPSRSGAGPRAGAQLVARLDLLQTSPKRTATLSHLGRRVARGVLGARLSSVILDIAPASIASAERLEGRHRCAAYIAHALQFSWVCLPRFAQACHAGKSPVDVPVSASAPAVASRGARFLEARPPSRRRSQRRLPRRGGGAARLAGRRLIPSYRAAPLLFEMRASSDHNQPLPLARAARAPPLGTVGFLGAARHPHGLAVLGPTQLLRVVAAAAAMRIQPRGTRGIWTQPLYARDRTAMKQNHQADFCPSRANSARHHGSLAESESTLAEVWPTPVDLGDTRARRPTSAFVSSDTA